MAYDVSMNILAKLIKYNNWASDKLIDACIQLTDEQLDAKPLPTFEWSIRYTLTHLVISQHGYLSLLTLPPEQRKRPYLEMDDLKESALQSGEGILALLDSTIIDLNKTVQTTDGYSVEPWVVINQAVSHATEHRQQINRMLRILEVTPPDLDGWTFGEVTNALVPSA